MIQVTAGGALVYDSRIDDYAVLGLKTTTGLNKGGTAEIILPPGHPAYNSFISYRTVVALRENDKLKFRGRVLYTEDDFRNCRTVTCEGERCFLRDAIIRPYACTGTPADIFGAAVTLYNEDVDAFKRFTLGRVTVTDPNNYITIASESAETFAAFFDKLVERCGGFITFSDDGNGGRAINWLAEIGTQSGQAIEFGANLLDFARSGQSPDLATAIRPYGAKQADGTRLTIASVTPDGADWIQDDEAVALRGRIMATETWDDVTVPANLLTKARQRLAQRRMLVTSLQLTAVDLSRQDCSIDSFDDGDQIRVVSKPHGLDGWFQLTERTVDWLDPSGSSISLGRTVTSLTGAGYSATQNAVNAAHKAESLAGAVGSNIYVPGTLQIDGGKIMPGTILAEQIRSGVFISADGTVRVDLGNNVVSIDGTREVDVDGVTETFRTRLELDANGVRGYGENQSRDGMEMTLELYPGAGGQGTLIWNPEWRESTGMTIAPASGLFTLGTTMCGTQIHGSLIEFHNAMGGGVMAAIDSQGLSGRWGAVGQSDDGGYYADFGSFKVCWGQLVMKYSATTSGNGNYYGDAHRSTGDITGGTFGAQFTGEPTINLQVRQGTTSVLELEAVNVDSTGIQQIRVHRANSYTDNVGVLVDYFAIGF